MSEHHGDERKREALTPIERHAIVRARLQHELEERNQAALEPAVKRNVELELGTANAYEAQLSPTQWRQVRRERELEERTLERGR